MQNGLLSIRWESLRKTHIAVTCTCVCQNKRIPRHAIVAWPCRLTVTKVRLASGAWQIMSVMPKLSTPIGNLREPKWEEGRASCSQWALVNSIPRCYYFIDHKVIWIICSWRCDYVNLGQTSPISTHFSLFKKLQLVKKIKGIVFVKKYQGNTQVH
jgi:ribosomal protein L37AE/L43A